MKSLTFQLISLLDNNSATSTALILQGLTIYFTYGLHCYMPIMILNKEYVKPHVDETSTKILFIWDLIIRLVITLITCNSVNYLSNIIYNHIGNKVTYKFFRYFSRLDTATRSPDGARRCGLLVHTWNPAASRHVSNSLPRKLWHLQVEASIRIAVVYRWLCSNSLCDVRQRQSPHSAVNNLQKMASLPVVCRALSS